MPPYDAGSVFDLLRRPTLLSSCAQAATAEEARYRLTYTRATQATCVIALDAGAAPIVSEVASREWEGGPRFLVLEGPAGEARDGSYLDAWLRAADGEMTQLSVELQAAEVVVMVATSDDASEAAELIGDECAERCIMTTGLVLADWNQLAATVSSLRPNAMVVVISRDEDELASMLSALRA